MHTKDSSQPTGISAAGVQLPRETRGSWVGVERAKDPGRGRSQSPLHDAKDFSLLLWVLLLVYND